ncbi:MAG: DUF5651 domain-containing protein [Cetobacterium sp.]
MKEYLNAQELNDLLFTFYLIERNRDTVDSWQERDNLTKEEAKYLRMAATYTEKMMMSVLKRLPTKQVDKFMHRTVREIKDPVRLIDKWTVDRVLGRYDEAYKVVKMPRVEFEYLAMTLIDQHCKGCKKSFQDCDLYTLLDNNVFPTCDEARNCPYGFVPPGTEKSKKDKEKGKVSKRKQKKLANRFDEDGE